MPPTNGMQTFKQPINNNKRFIILPYELDSHTKLNSRAKKHIERYKMKIEKKQ